MESPVIKKKITSARGMLLTCAVLALAFAGCALLARRAHVESPIARY